jgi:signal transduction histidine kinase
MTRPRTMISGRLYLVAGSTLVVMELQDRLRALGHTIAGVAGRPEVAMREIPGRAVDVVLIDVHLAGGRSGAEAATWLGGAPDLGVVFLAAVSDSPRVDGAQQGETRDDLVTSYLEDELQTTIQRALIERKGKAEGRRHEDGHAAELRMLQAQKSESLVRMGAALTHWFSNLLTVVIGEMEIIRREVPDRERALTSAERVRVATQRAVELNRRVRRYVQRPRARLDTLDLGQACRTAADRIRAGLPENVAFSTDIPATGPVVWAQADLLHDAVAELVTNAVEALDGTPGTIAVDLRRVDAASVKRWRTYPPEWESTSDFYASVNVGDTGPGMTDEVLDRLFDPFFSTKFIGRGLGLPLVLSTARALQGAVAVETQHGNGSTFRLLVPIAVVPQAAAR